MKAKKPAFRQKHSREPLNPIPAKKAGLPMVRKLYAEMAIEKCGLKEDWEVPGGWVYQHLCDLAGSIIIGTPDPKRLAGGRFKLSIAPEDVWSLGKIPDFLHKNAPFPPGAKKRTSGTASKPKRLLFLLMLGVGTKTLLAEGRTYTGGYHV